MIDTQNAIRTENGIYTWGRELPDQSSAVDMIEDLIKDVKEVPAEERNKSVLFPVEELSNFLRELITFSETPYETYETHEELNCMATLMCNHLQHLFTDTGFLYTKKEKIDGLFRLEKLIVCTYRIIENKCDENFIEAIMKRAK